MSLSFAAGQFALQSWGFSANDIAHLAGAGRAVGTWVMNQIKDQTLLQFMRVDPEDLIPRKGLIDTTALHQRWDIRLTLLQNGDKRIIGGNGVPVVESMGTFSWFMTLVTSALDATHQKSSMMLAMSNFLTNLFEDHVDALDYLQRELPHHVQGWMSAAVVRNITHKSRHVWQSALEQKLRLPGSIPDGEVHEIVRFLVWLTGAKDQTSSKQFGTTSSDVYAFAMILHGLGLDMMELSIGDDIQDMLESKLVVKYLPGTLSTITATEEQIMKQLLRNKKRFGMRIPLESPEECVSLWPGGAGANNDRRQLFKDGVAACQTLEICTHNPKKAYEYISEVAYIVHDPTMKLAGRAQEAAHRLASAYFLFPTPYIIDQMFKIMSQYPDWDERTFYRIDEYLRTNPAALSKLQVFIMGYYYTLLGKIIDISKLSIPEAYGSWRWFDAKLLSTIRDILVQELYFTKDQSDVHSLSRRAIFKLVALLIVGADSDQLRAIDKDTIGIHGKISVVCASLLGAVRSQTCVSKLVLLDIDSTAIPSNVKGIIRSGVKQSLPPIKPRSRQDVTLQNLDSVDPAGLAEDFTCHIEPDWDNDIQLCQVVYRFKGRLIARLSPITIESAWLIQIPGTMLDHSERSVETHKSIQVRIGKIEELDHLEIQEDLVNPASGNYESAQLFQTRGCLKARACLMAWYHLRGLVRLEVLDPVSADERQTSAGSEGKPQGYLLLYHTPSPDRDFLKLGPRIVLA